MEPGINTESEISGIITQKEFIDKSGEVCPGCLCDYIAADGVFDPSRGCFTRRMECTFHGCNARWKQHFTLKGFCNLHIPGHAPKLKMQMTATTNADRQGEFLAKNGLCCPQCEEDNIAPGDDCTFEVDGATATRTMQCHNQECGVRWDEDYVLTHFIEFHYPATGERLNDITSQIRVERRVPNEAKIG